MHVSVQVNPSNLDPNVHPTKKEVKFLFENEIAAEIERWMFGKLRNTAAIKIMKENDVIQQSSSMKPPATSVLSSAMKPAPPLLSENRWSGIIANK